MRIHFDNVTWRAATGPNVFATRLAAAMAAMGHEALDEALGADASLCFIEPSGRPLARKVVQRLDGIWFKASEFVARNGGIKSLYGRADAVVWQSGFDRQMTTRWWGEPRQGLVIQNGAPLRPVRALTIPRLIELRAVHDRIYVCSANWHPQKRLEANVALFERLRERHPRSCLIVLGANADMRVASGPHVFYTGSVSHDVSAEIYSAANWMLHLAWADHCPNVVVEALAQGTPVACSEVGGTKELIGDYGVVLREEPYGFELTDYDDPPPIDVSQVDDLPDRLELNYGSIADIDIASVARRYVELFERLLAV